MAEPLFRPPHRIWRTGHARHRPCCRNPVLHRPGLARPANHQRISQHTIIGPGWRQRARTCPERTPRGRQDVWTGRQWPPVQTERHLVSTRVALWRPNTESPRGSCLGGFCRPAPPIAFGVPLKAGSNSTGLTEEPSPWPWSSVGLCPVTIIIPILPKITCLQKIILAIRRGYPHITLVRFLPDDTARSLT
jgi:hypothetical protein